jgi:hypothetical protein
MRALDHAAGYLLAFGIAAALCKTVTVSSYTHEHLPDCMRWNRRVAHGASTSHSARRSSGSDDSGACTRSLRSERVALCRLVACLSTRKSRTFQRRSNGTRVTLGVVGSRRMDWDRRCRLFGTRPVSRDLGSERERHRCGLMRTSPSDCHDYSTVRTCTAIRCIRLCVCNPIYYYVTTCDTPTALSRLACAWPCSEEFSS